MLRPVCLGALLTLATASAWADTFGSGANAFTIDFTTIGFPNNPGAQVGTIPGDGPRGSGGTPIFAGVVPYQYRIATFEVPEHAIERASAAGGLGLTTDGRGPNKPATSLSWFDAARFVNWLNEDAGHAPAYKFDDQGAFQLWEPTDPGYNAANLFRNADARYFLASNDEWYKAAYYDPLTEDYFTYPGSDTRPSAVDEGNDPGTAVYSVPAADGPADVELAGGPNQFGVVGMAGNVWETVESAFDGANTLPLEDRIAWGGEWNSGLTGPDVGRFGSVDVDPAVQYFTAGIRIVAIPEPTSAILLSLAIALTTSSRRRL